MPFRGSYEAGKSGGSSNWLGFQEVALTDVVNKSDNFDKLDIYLECHFRNEVSQFPYKYNLLGTFEKDDDGRISGENSLLKRILYFTDAISWDGGINTEGNWVDKDDKPLVDEDGKDVNVADYLNAHFTAANYGVSNFDTPFYVYVYKRWSEKDGKAYTTVCPKIVKNNAKDRSDLESYIKYMKANKFLKEHVDTKSQVNNGEMTTRSTTSSTQTSF